MPVKLTLLVPLISPELGPVMSQVFAVAAAPIGVVAVRDVVLVLWPTSDKLTNALALMTPPSTVMDAVVGVLLRLNVEPSTVALVSCPATFNWPVLVTT